MALNLSDSTPAAPSGKQNVKFQKDGAGNISAYVDNFVYTQSVPSDTWVINHNLGKHPTVTVTDSAGTLVMGSIAFNSLNQITVSFSAAFSGVAYVN